MLGSRYQPAVVPDHLHVRMEPTLPPASWLAVVDGDGASVVCGSAVERGAAGVVEGNWDGPFADFDFDRAESFFGSGVRLRPGELRFVAPSHTLESLYLHETEGRLAVSNSLAFLLEHERVPLPPGEPICATLATIAYGTRDHRAFVLPHAGGRVARIVHAVVALTSSGLEWRPRRSERRFGSYAAYRDHLIGTVERVLANGADERRAQAYALLATVSSGYDSSACAAVAAAGGCSEAVTLARSRFGRPDSGEEIARHLGLRVEAFDRDAAVRDASAAQMAELMASGHGGEDLPFVAFEPRLRGRVLVTGWAGTLWDAHGEANDVLLKKDLSGTSLGEYRLRVGFVHLPLVCVGGLSGFDVMAITQSDEMRPFSLGNDYDKPIARRLLEEAGVPRSAFGQSKEAVSVLGFTDLRGWPTAARAAFADYVRDRAGPGLRLRQRLWVARSFVWRALRKAVSKLLGRRLPQPLERWFLGADWVVFEHAAPITSELAFRWALEVVRPRYAGVRAEAAAGGDASAET